MLNPLVSLNFLMHVFRSMLNAIRKMTSIKKQSRIEYYKIILQNPVEAETVSSYVEDVRLENKVADFIINIDKGKLNIADINDWWQQFRDNTMYHLLNCNCCTVIFQALKKGGSETFMPLELPEIATPDSLKEYAFALRERTNEEEL